MPGGLRLPQVRDVQVGQQPSNLPTTTFQLLQQPTTIPPQTNPLLSSRSAAIPALGRGQPPPRLPFSLASNRTPLAPTQQASGYYTPKPPDYAPYTSQDVENQVPEEIASSVNPEITSANDVRWRPSPRDSLRFRSVSGPNAPSVHLNSSGLEPVRETGMGGAQVSRNWQREIVTMPGGRLTVELPMPRQIQVQHPSHFGAPLSTYPHFDTVRYSCINHDPDLLKLRGWDLRQRPIPNASWRHQPNLFVPNSAGLWENRPMIDGSSKSLWNDGYALADEAGEGGDRPRIEVSFLIPSTLLLPPFSYLTPFAFFPFPPQDLHMRDHLQREGRSFRAYDGRYLS